MEIAPYEWCIDIEMWPKRGYLHSIYSMEIAPYLMAMVSMQILQLHGDISIISQVDHQK